MSKTKSAATLELVALGGSIQERRRGREAVAQSEVAIRLNSDAAVENCLRGLDLSDRRLAEVPQMYDWVMVWKETEEGKPGATVRFGVAWYDEAYFQEKKARTPNECTGLDGDTHGLRSVAGAGGYPGTVRGR